MDIFDITNSLGLLTVALFAPVDPIFCVVAVLFAVNLILSIALNLRALLRK
jgi:hypothetical protein